MMIGFDELVTLAKHLPKRKWNQLKEKVELEHEPVSTKEELIAFLLTAPTFSEKQVNRIEKTRKEMETWREKLS